ncbi:MAG: thioesterase family protein [Desulfobacteraceae bacterium]|nr:thioesterase family protein [Desulfobacteraceae bacterium]
MEQIRALPSFHRESIPDDYLDAMGHMNIRWYMAIYDQATWHFFKTIGLTDDYFQTYDAGAFALKQFVNYFNEVQAGHTVAVHTRLLGRSEKRFHFMHFMVNENNCNVASSIEFLGTHVDLKQRRSAPFPPFIAEAFDARLYRHRLIDWDPPVCGILNL